MNYIKIAWLKFNNCKRSNCKFSLNNEYEIKKCYFCEKIITDRKESESIKQEDLLDGSYIDSALKKIKESGWRGV